MLRRYAFKKHSNMTDSSSEPIGYKSKIAQQVEDEEISRLLEENNDETKLHHQFDKGDSKYLEDAYSDMRKLDAILRNKLDEERRLRKKRKCSLLNIRQTLSEIRPVHPHSAGYLEIENTDRCASETELELSERDTDGVPPSPTKYAYSGSNNPSQSSNISETVFPQEFGDLSERWALAPFESDDDVDKETSSEEDESEQHKPEEPNIRENRDIDYSFGSRPPQVDHVQRNIECGGHYYTPSEKARLDELLQPVEHSEDQHDKSLIQTDVNPFQVLQNDLTALQDIDELLKRIKKNRQADEVESHSEVFGSDHGNANSRFFRRGEDHEKPGYRRIIEINNRLRQIEEEEKRLLMTIFEGNEIQRLAEGDDISHAVEEAVCEQDYMQNSQDQAMEIVPSLSENEIGLLLGPDPKISQFSTPARTENGTGWGIWLNERQKSLLDFKNVLAADQYLATEIQSQRENLCEDFHPNFSDLVNEVREVTRRLDVLIASDHGTTETPTCATPDLLHQLLPDEKHLACIDLIS